MHEIKLTWLAMFATLALSSIAWAAPASAAELIKFSKTGRFATSTGAALVEVSNGKEMECENIEIKGK